MNELNGFGSSWVQARALPSLNTVRKSRATIRDLDIDSLGQTSEWRWLRPAEGLAPGRKNEIFGKRMKRTLGQGEKMGLEDWA